MFVLFLKTKQLIENYHVYLTGCKLKNLHRVNAILGKQRGRTQVAITIQPLILSVTSNNKRIC